MDDSMSLAFTVESIAPCGMDCGICSGYLNGKCYDCEHVESWMG